MEDLTTVSKRLDSHIEIFEKKFEKHEELRLIDGDHMSHIRADLTEVKKTIDKIEELVARMEPVIKAYEKSIIVKENDEQRANKVGKWATLIGSIGIIGGAIIWIAKKVLIEK